MRHWDTLSGIAPLYAEAYRAHRSLAEKHLAGWSPETPRERERERERRIRIRISRHESKTNVMEE